VSNLTYGEKIKSGPQIQCGVNVPRLQVLLRKEFNQELHLFGRDVSDSFTKGPSVGREAEKTAGSYCVQKIVSSLQVGQTEKLISTSLSHSKGFILAVGVDQDAVLGIGIDLEKRSRDINESVRSRILSPREKELGLSFLQCWTAKEASFKANPQNQSTLVTDYEVTEFQVTEDSSVFLAHVTCSFWGRSGMSDSDNRPQKAFQVCLVDIVDWVIAVSLLAKPGGDSGSFVRS